MRTHIFEDKIDVLVVIGLDDLLQCDDILMVRELAQEDNFSV
jgi:hypothetical protein